MVGIGSWRRGTDPSEQGRYDNATGEFIYATAGYESNNLLLHAYLDTPQYLREIEGTESHYVAVVDDVSVLTIARSATSTTTRSWQPAQPRCEST
jgi:hypothetical protein